MKTFRFEEELLREGYLFIASSDSKARYILLNKGKVTDNYITDFSEINLYYNILKRLDDCNYLLVYYQPLFNRYKLMIVDLELLKRYPLLAKLLGSDKVTALEVQGILSILNTKLRQQEWSNNEIYRTDMINVPTLTRKN